MSSKASWLILSLMTGAVWTSHASAAVPDGAAAAEPTPKMVKGYEPRTAEAKSEAVKAPPAKKAETPKLKSTAAVSKARVPRSAKSTAAKVDTKPRLQKRAKAKAAAAPRQRVLTGPPMKSKDLAAQRKRLKAEKPDRYVRERERGLDTAAIYAPKTIARLRRNRTIERTEDPERARSSGWRYYVDTYARGR